MLFYTGITRSADTILRHAVTNISATLPQLNRLRDLAAATSERLRSGDVEAVGTAIQQGWETKRQLASGVSNEQIDRAVDPSTRNSGATGVKVTGAGGGGFLLVICPPERQRAVRHSLCTLKELPIRLDRLGSRVVLNVIRDIWS